MSSHSHRDSVSALSNPGRAGLAVVRRANGRTLRKSCDRCHQQKLQCVGDKAPLTRCKRCQRAGLKCVYSARSSRKAGQCNIDYNNWDALDTWATWDNPAGELDTIFGLESTQLDDIFPISPVSATGTGESAPFLAHGFPALEHRSGTSMNMMNMPLQSSGSLPEEGHVPITEPHDTLAGLACAFNELEATFARTVEEQAGREAQDCMILIPPSKYSQCVIHTDFGVQILSAMY